MTKKMKDNVWNRIPLQDYELHMKHETVGQLHLLNTLTKKYLEKVNPEIVMILGIAGGNQQLYYQTSLWNRHKPKLS